MRGGSKELAQAMGRANAELNSALEDVRKAEEAGDEGAAASAMKRVYLAEEARRRVMKTMREKGAETRKGLRTSKKERYIEELRQENDVLREGVRLIRAGVELAESEGDLEDWLDAAKDFLEETERS